MEVSQRRFGVEIECGGTRADLVKACQEATGKRPHVHTDGSGNEIHTGILRGENGILHLQKMLDAIRYANGWVSTRDGMHVHHDAPEFIGRLDLQQRLVRNFVAIETAIESIIAPYRRGNYASCRRQFSKETVLTRTPTGRGKLNLSNLVNHEYNPLGTVEFRGHEGCLHPQYAAAWVCMGQALLDRTLESKKLMKDCSTVRTLSRRLDLDTDVTELLIEKSKYVKNPKSVQQARTQPSLDVRGW